MDILWTVLALLIFAAGIVLLFFTKKSYTVKGKKIKLGFSIRIIIALVLGIIFGLSLQLIFGEPAQDASGKIILTGAGSYISDWINIIGAGFTKALQLIIVPLVLVSIISAITKMGGSKAGLKKSGITVGFLLLTTAVSAMIAIGVTGVFNLSASNLIDFNTSTQEPASITSAILNLIPNNLFAALSSNSVLPVVFIAILIGMAYLAIKKKNPETGVKFESGLHTVQKFVMKIVSFVIKFTPYGVLAIVTVRMASGSLEFISQLGLIIAASFVAMLAVFLMHLLIMWVSGVNPIRYIKKAAPALLFAFSSRSSAATLPLTIEAQRRLGVSEANANLAGSLGTCIGQNACAGVYPTMVALLVGLVQGWNVWSVFFLVPLVLYVVIASIGTAGVGGGATNVTLVVLSLMGLPIELVAILISVDFIIDMGRTLVNVSDSIVAGYVTGKLEKDINKDVLSGKVSFEELKALESSQRHEGENI